MNKVINVVLSIAGFALMLIAIMFAFAFEMSWLYVVMAVVVCPVWFWTLLKRIFKHHVCMLRILQAFIVVISLVVMVIMSVIFPYHRNYSMINKNKAEEYFTAKSDRKITEISEFKRSSENENLDYVKIIMKVVSEKSDKSQTSDVLLCFDRLTGDYYPSFKEMRQSRRTNSLLHNVCMFDADEVNEHADKDSLKVIEDKSNQILQSSGDCQDRKAKKVEYIDSGSKENQKLKVSIRLTYEKSDYLLTIIYKQDYSIEKQTIDIYSA